MKTSLSIHHCRVGCGSQHPAEDRAEPPAGIPTSGITGQEGRAEKRAPQPRSVFPGKHKIQPNKANNQQTRPPQLYNANVFQPRGALLAAARQLNEGSLHVLLLLLLPGYHQLPHNWPLLHRACGSTFELKHLTPWQAEPGSPKEKLCPLLPFCRVPGQSTQPSATGTTSASSVPSRGWGKIPRQWDYAQTMAHKAAERCRSQTHLLQDQVWDAGRQPYSHCNHD